MYQAYLALSGSQKILLQNHTFECRDEYLGGTTELKSAPSSPSRSPTACRFKSSHLASRVSQGERRVSEGRAPRGSRARSPSIDGSQNGPSSLRYFGLPPAQPLRLALVDPTDRHIRAWKPVCHARSLITTRAFPLLLSPSPSSHGRLLVTEL